MLRKIERHGLGQQEILAILLPAHVLHHRGAACEAEERRQLLVRGPHAPVLLLLPEQKHALKHMITCPSQVSMTPRDAFRFCLKPTAHKRRVLRRIPRDRLEQIQA